MNRAKLVAGISLLGMAITAYWLGYSTFVGDIGSGTVTIYPAAALALLGCLALLSEVKRV